MVFACINYAYDTEIIAKYVKIFNALTFNMELFSRVKQDFFFILSRVQMTNENIKEILSYDWNKFHI